MDDICDSHFHVFGAADRYPMVSTRGYEPPVLSISDYQALFGPLGVRRMVLIQPSCYGSDNRCMLDALATLGERGRAVVAVAPDTSDADLRQMHDRGARGIRVNAVGGSTLSIVQLRDIAPRLRQLGWHVQTFLPKGRLPDLADDLLATGLAVVLDHFGSPDPTLGIEQPTLQTLKGRGSLSGSRTLCTRADAAASRSPRMGLRLALRPFHRQGSAGLQSSCVFCRRAA